MYHNTHILFCLVVRFNPSVFYAYKCISNTQHAAVFIYTFFKILCFISRCFTVNVENNVVLKPPFFS